MKKITERLNCMTSNVVPQNERTVYTVRITEATIHCVYYNRARFLIVEQRKLFVVRDHLNSVVYFLWWYTTIFILL